LSVRAVRGIKKRPDWLPSKGRIKTVTAKEAGPHDASFYPITGYISSGFIGALRTFDSVPHLPGTDVLWIDGLVVGAVLAEEACHWTSKQAPIAAQRQGMLLAAGFLPRLDFDGQIILHVTAENLGIDRENRGVSATRQGIGALSGKHVPLLDHAVVIRPHSG